MQVEFINIKKSFEKEDFKSIYLFHGDENYYNQELSSLIQKHCLTEAERAFNEYITYASEIEPGALVDLSRQYPMMSERRLIIVKEAEKLKINESLIDYITKPEKSTVLAFVMTKKTDKRTKFYKACKKNGVIFESKKLYENQIPKWIKSYILGSNREIELNAIQVLSSFVGTDLSKLSKEIDKLFNNVKEGDTISEDDIYNYIGISKDFNVFELNKALGYRDYRKSILIAQHLMNDIKNNDPIWLTAAIFGYYQKTLIYHFYKNKGHKRLMESMSLSSSFFLTEYTQVAKNYSIHQVLEIIKLLSELDFKLKGVGQDAVPRAEIFLQYIVRILHL